MPKFRQLLGGLVDPLPAAAVISVETSFALPLVVVSEAPASTAPALYSLDPIDFESRVSPEWLALLWEEAQPKNTRGTFTYGVDPSDTECAPRLFEPIHFPLSEPRLTDIPAFLAPLQVSQNLVQLLRDPRTTVIVSENLFAALVSSISNNTFPRLAYARIMWHNYVERRWHAEPFPGIPSEEFKHKTKRFQLTLDSVVQPERVAQTKREPKRATFWDLILPLLQPPLSLGNLESLFLPSPLFNYQPAGIEFLMNNSSALLADEMGTGKTVMTVVALKILFQKGRIKHALIISPVSVLREWADHLDTWAPELVTVFVRGARDLRERLWNSEAHVYVTAYDSFRGDVHSNALPPSKSRKFDVVVVDEAQNIKNPSRGRSKAIRQLRPSQRWALTGTPVENKIDDIAALFEFLRPGLLTPYDLYPGRIKEKIKPYFLRRRKADVLPDLPPAIRQELWLELSPEQRRAYDSVSSQVTSELTALGSRVSKLDVFRNIQRLKQICNFAPQSLDSSKAGALNEKIDEIVQNGHKVIVFSQYVGEGVDKLEKVLSNYRCAKLVGSQSQTIRNNEIDRFKRANDVSVLLASVKAGGVGLNLTEASYVIHFDHWWNPAVMWQAEARVHRPGQKAASVNIYSYWVEDTIDRRIHEVLQRKGLLFKDVVDGLAETDIDELISTDEWLEILGVQSRVKVAQPTRSEGLAHLSVDEIRQLLQGISPSRFEHVVKELMRCLGYPTSRVTGRSGDGGIDVVASRNTESGIERAAAQCKRYRGTVDVGAARDFRGAITTDKTIRRGFLVTTGDFTRSCQMFCEQSGVLVAVSGVQLANYVKTFGISLD